jgi:hypothetical protein
MMIACAALGRGTITVAFAGRRRQDGVRRVYGAGAARGRGGAGAGEISALTAPHA